MTVHESSLSPSIHAIIAAELGREEKAVELYSRTARLDLDNYNNDTEDGLHINSKSGAWLSIVEGFAGMYLTEEMLTFKTFLPKKWEAYDFKINYRGRLIDVHVDKEGVRLTIEEGEPLEIKLFDEIVMISGTITKALK